MLFHESFLTYTKGMAFLENNILERNSFKYIQTKEMKDDRRKKGDTQQ